MNKSSLENNEIPKTSQENIEQKEISQEEFLSWADNEQSSFKQETQEELAKANSVGLDEPTFKKVKSETGVESDLSNLNKELEEIIAQAKASSTPINSYNVIPETVDYFLNNTQTEGKEQDQKFLQAQEAIKKIQDTNNKIWEAQKNTKEKILQDAIDQESDPETKVILREVGIPALTESFSHDEIEYFKQDPNRLIDRVNSDIAGVADDSIREMFSYAKGLHVNELVSKERKTEIKNKVREKVLDLYDHRLPGFKQKYLTITNSITENIQNDKNVESGSEDNSIVRRQKIKNEGELLLRNEISKLLNPELTITGEQQDIKTENIDRDYTQILLLGKKLSEFSEAVQEKYRESVEKYSQGLASGMEEKDENGLTSVDKLKNTIRTEYNSIMSKIGILSSPAGASDNWIYWDLGKQSYLSEHPQESNENYKLENPFTEQNQEILADIINRHVGWEVLGYVKNNPDFLNTLDKSKDSYSKIVSLVGEEKQLGKLSSYKLTELGKLIRENISVVPK